MIVTWQTLITISAVIAAIVAISGYFVKAVRWVDNQHSQDGKLDELREHHDKDIRGIQEEQTLLVYGILACLKGLKEQGCNGPVTEAINKIEKHLNNKAHQSHQ